LSRIKKNEIYLRSRYKNENLRNDLTYFFNDYIGKQSLSESNEITLSNSVTLSLVELETMEQFECTI